MECTVTEACSLACGVKCVLCMCACVWPLSGWPRWCLWPRVWSCGALAVSSRAPDLYSTTAELPASPCLSGSPLKTTCSLLVLNTQTYTHTHAHPHTRTSTHHINGLTQRSSSTAAHISSFFAKMHYAVFKRTSGKSLMLSCFQTIHIHFSPSASASASSPGSSTGEEFSSGLSNRSSSSLNCSLTSLSKSAKTSYFKVIQINTVTIAQECERKWIFTVFGISLYFL